MFKKQNKTKTVKLEKNMGPDFLMEQLLKSTDSKYNEMPSIIWGFDLDECLKLADELPAECVDLEILHQQVFELGHLEKNQPMKKWKHLLDNYVEED